MAKKAVTNYICLWLLLTERARDILEGFMKQCLRKVYGTRTFEQILDTGNAKREIKEHSQLLPNEELKALYPFASSDRLMTDWLGKSSNTVSTDDLNIFLIYFCLQTICGLKPKECPVWENPKGNSKEAAIARIWQKHLDFIYNPPVGINDEKFEELWEDTVVSMKQLSTLYTDEEYENFKTKNNFRSSDIINVLDAMIQHAQKKIRCDKKSKTLEKLEDSVKDHVDEGMNNLQACFETDMKHLLEQLQEATQQIEGKVQDSTDNITDVFMQAILKIGKYLSGHDKTKETLPRHPAHNLPGDSTRTFIGRKQLLAQVTNQINQPVGNRCILTLKGSHGIGKATLALEYAYRNQRNYSFVRILNADDFCFQTELQTFANQIGLPCQDTEISDLSHTEMSDLLSKLIEKLVEIPRWLLILINLGKWETCLDTIRQTHHYQHIIVTSSTEEVRVSENTIHVTSFEENEAETFLRSRLDKKIEATDDDIRNLATQLQYHPIILEIAVGTLVQTKLSIKKYQKEIDETYIHIQMKKKYQKTLAKVLQVALDKIQEKKPNYKKLLLCFLLMFPKQIPALLMFHCDQELTLTKNILHKFHIIQCWSNHIHFHLSIHPLLQQILWYSLSDDNQGQHQTEIISAMQTVGQVIVDNITQNGCETKYDLYNMVKHFEICTGNVQHLIKITTCDEIFATDLLNVLEGMLGKCMKALMKVKKFRMMVNITEKLLEIKIQKYGAKSREAAKAMFCHGRSLIEHGNYMQGETLLRNVVKFFKEILDRETVYCTANAVGKILKDIGKPDRAAIYFEIAEKHKK